MKKETSGNSTKKTTAAESVDDYLAGLPEEPRAALESLRKTIRSVLPDAIEVISYRIPVFKYKGRSLVAIAAFENHCSFFPMSQNVMRTYAERLKGYDLAKGTIRFPANKPLPATLVRMIVKARIAENEKIMKKRGGY